MAREVIVRAEPIRLGQLLKLAGIIDSGSDAKHLLASELVLVNGQRETRRGRQLRDGDRVHALEQELRVTLAPRDPSLREGASPGQGA